MGRIILALGLLTAATPAVAQTTGRIDAPGDDAYVLQSTPTTSYGNADELRSGVGSQATEVYRAFVRFPLPRSGEIVSATLKGTYVSHVGGGPGLQSFDFVADDAWSPATLTWNDQPAASAEHIATLDPATFGSSIEPEIDVTSLARREQSGDGWLSVRIAAASEGTTSRISRWTGRAHASNPSFRLELVVSPAPRLEVGDVVGFDDREGFAGIVGIDPEEGVQKALAPIRFAYDPYGVAVHPDDGTAFVADSMGMARVELAGGNVEAFAPRDAGSPFYHLALDPEGEGVYAGAPGLILRYDVATGAREVWTSAESLCEPAGIAVGDTHLWVADACGGVIGFERSGRTQDVVFEEGLSGLPDGIAIDADGNLLVADGAFDTGRIVRIDPETGSTAVVATLGFRPGSVAVAPDGTIWVASHRDTYTSMCCAAPEVGRIDAASGVYTRVWSRYESVAALAVAPDGAPVVTGTDAALRPRVIRIDPLSEGESLVASPLLPSVQKLFFDANRKLLAVDSSRVIRVDPATGRQSVLVPPARLACAFDCWIEDAAMAPDGRLVLLRHFAVPFGEAWTDAWELIRIDPKTGALTAEPAEYADQIAIERDGAMLRAWSGATSGTIVRVDPVSGVSSLLATGSALRAIDALALDGHGTIFVGGEQAAEIQRVDPESGAIEMVASSAGVRPSHLVVDSVGRFVAWGDFASRPRLVLYDPASATRSLLSTSPELGSRQAFAVLAPRCANGFDDDRDGAIDADDPTCATHGREHPWACGSGIELVALLWALRARRRR